MADLLLLIKPSRLRGAQFLSQDKDTGAELRSVHLDATVSESFDEAVTFTEHPVEDGTTIADHAVRAPLKLTITGVVTRTPGWMVQPGQTLNPAHLDDMLRGFGLLLKDRQPITVYTGLRAYPPLYLESVGTTRSAGDGQKVNITLGLKEIETVKAQTALVPALPVKKEKKADATPEQSQGTQAPTETTPEAETGATVTGDEVEDKSVAAELWDRGSTYFSGGE